MKKLLKFALTLFIVHCTLFIDLHAQVAINNDNSEPDASAMLDVKSSDKGMFITRMNTSTREVIASGAPTESLWVYDTDTHSFWYYNASAWTELRRTKSLLTDADGDTKIQVDNGNNNNVIRFDIKGQESVSLERSSAGNVSLEIKDANDNTVLGNDAGMSLTLGTTNVMIGQNAGRIMDVGGENVLLGEQAGRQGEGFSANIFIGRYAGFNSTNNAINTFVGYNTGRTNNATKNVFIGADAANNGTFTSRRDALVIDNTNTNNPILYGDFAADSLRVNGKMEVKGSIAPDKFIDKDEDTNIEISNDAMLFESSSVNLVQIKSNANNDFVLNPSSNNNLILGRNTATSNTGGKNLFIGNETAMSNTSGSNNVFIGNEAGKANTNGGNNTYVGVNTGDTATGSNNVIVGRRVAGVGGSGGSNNVMIGKDAGLQGSGSGNVFIGHEAGRDETGNNKLYIDRRAEFSPLIYGEFDNESVTINNRLEVSSVQVTNSNKAIAAVLYTSHFRNIGNVSGNSSRIETFSFSGARAGDVVAVTPGGLIQSQVVIAQAWVSADDTISVRFRNTGTGSQNPDGSGFDYDFMIIKVAN